MRVEPNSIPRMALPASIVCFAVILLQGFVQHVVHLVVLELLLEVVGTRLLVDLDILDADHFSEVFPVLLVDVVGEGAVVCAASEWRQYVVFGRAGALLGPGNAAADTRLFW